MKIPSVKLVLAAVVILSACASCVAKDKNGLTSSNKKNIIVTEKTVKGKYKVIRKLDVLIKKGAPQYGGYRSEHDVEAVLRYQAQQLGADAVIKVRYKNVPMSLFSWGEVSGTGIAIKFIK